MSDADQYIPKGHLLVEDGDGERLVKNSSELPSSTGSGTAKLKAALLAWRKAEQSYAHAVLAACHPRTVREFSDATESALHKVRVIVV